MIKVRYYIDKEKLEELVEKLRKASCLPEGDYISNLIIDTDTAISLIKEYLNVKENIGGKEDDKNFI